MQPQPATQPLPGFTAEQTASLQACISAQIAANNKVLLDQMRVLINDAFDKHFGPPVQTQQSIPPAPQAKKEEVKETRPQLLYQATVEDAEDNAEKESKQQYGSSKHGSTKPDSKSTLSSMPCLCTTRSSGNSAAFLSKALRFATHHALTLVGTPLGYIRCSEGMEPTGEG